MTTQPNAPQTTPDLPALLDGGLATFAGEVAKIGPTDWDRPSVCAGWTVRDLVGHVLSTMSAGSLILRDQPVPPSPERPGDAVDPQASPEQVAMRVDELADDFREALAGADLGQTRETPGGPRTLADGLAFPVVDLAVHSWDLAASLGHELELPADLLAYSDAFSRSVPADVTRRPGVFGPEVEAPQGATPTQTLMAFLGRAVPDDGDDVWTRLEGPASGGSSGWVLEQLAAIDAAGTTAAAEVDGRPIVVVTMLGASSGRARRVPVMRVEHDGVYAAVASKGGAPEHPQWYANLLATPRVLLQDGSSTSRRRVREIDGAEREQWWERCVEAFPPYAEYVERAGDRVIPVFLLEPVKG